MASIVLIESNGTIKTLKTKELTNETLYKKCGFRVNEDFLSRQTWQVKLNDIIYTVSVWAKKTGKANSENKYDFPPPIDKDLFFGTCAVVRTVSKTDDKFLDLTKEEWLKIYEKLFGGFEDIGDEDEYSEDELANVDPALLTKNGYLKDGFVVSDKELTSGSVTPDIEDNDDDDEDYVDEKKKKKVVKTETVVKKQRKTPAKQKPIVNSKAKAATTKAQAKQSASTPIKQAKQEEDDDESDENTEDTASELEEEVYTFSDDD
jgi:hypothetical protein